MKHTKNKYFRILLIAGLVFSLQSCLKDNNYAADFSKGAPAVELPLAAKYTNKPFAASFDISITPTTYYAVVNVASVDKPSSTVTATIGIDSAFLNQYNFSQDSIAKAAQAAYLAADTSNTVDDSSYPPDYSPFELLPDSAYQIPSFAATINAGHRQDSIPILISTSKLASGHNYILPITILSSSLPISNWNHLLINVGAKNQYDGKYASSGVFTHPAYGVLTWDFSKGITQELVTSGISSVSMYPTITSIGAFGAELDITVNADNSLVEVFNGATTPTPNSDHYDPDTRTFYVSGAYLGGSGPRTYKATLKYTGPR